MTTRIAAANLYANDEDLLIACSGDFPELAPISQIVAEGIDGSFPAADAGSWVLSSSLVNFATRGVSAGQVCQLIEPVTYYRTPDLLIVDSVSGLTCTLRRPAATAGLGHPPGPSTGINGVRFRIATLYPQIESATYELNQLFALDPNIAGRTFADLYDAREAQKACIALVLAQQYLAQARAAGKLEDFTYKSRLHREDYKAIVTRATLHLSRQTNGQSEARAWPTLTR